MTSEHSPETPAPAPETPAPAPGTTAPGAPVSVDPALIETMPLEVLVRPDGSVPTADEVVRAFEQVGVLGAAVAGSEFGLGTPVVAKVALAMVGDDPLVLATDSEGSLVPTEFSGEFCGRLASKLGAPVVADEYVLYTPGSGEPEFIELDPRRQSIDQPAGFPNEWRVSPERLESRALALVKADSAAQVGPALAHAIALDTGAEVRRTDVDGWALVDLPSGVTELPLTLPTAGPVILIARAGNARYVHVAGGTAKKPLSMTVANLPRLAPTRVQEQGHATTIVENLCTPTLVAGSLSTSHPQFPHQLAQNYARLAAPAAAGQFFEEIAALLGLPKQAAAMVEGTLAFPTDAVTHGPQDQAPQPAQKRGLLRTLGLRRGQN